VWKQLNIPFMPCSPEWVQLAYSASVRTTPLVAVNRNNWNTVEILVSLAVYCFYQTKDASFNIWLTFIKLSELLQNLQTFTFPMSTFTNVVNEIRFNNDIQGHSDFCWSLQSSRDDSLFSLRDVGLINVSVVEKALPYHFECLCWSVWYTS